MKLAICAVLFLFFTAISPAQKYVVGYVPNWIDLPAFAETIEYSKLTHLNVAFENPIDDAGTMSFEPKNEPLIKRARANRVKVLVSIGGGLASTDKVLCDRYFNLISDRNRAAFVSKLTDYVVRHNFDGLDVDLEGPSINKDYGVFIADLAKALKPKGKLLTAALSQGYGGDSVPSSVFAHFDFVNVMAYDGTGPWNKDRAGQHSSLDFAKNNVAYWNRRGLPKSKTVLGVPFYGYGFGDAYRNDGYAYRELLTKYPEAENLDEVGKTIWHNGIPTMRAKARYILDEGLAGAMIWSIDQDVKGPKSLLAALHAALKRS